MKTFYKVVNITIILICFSVYSLQAQSNFKSPAYEHFILDNGLEVYMVVQKEVPLVHFRAVVPAGVRQDSDEYAGLSELTANLLSSGTASYDKETIETTLDFIGASYNSSSNMETSVLTSSFINKDSELVLPILIEMLTKPSFKEAEFVKLKKRAVAGVDQSRESPRSVINNYFNQLVYGDHPYANIPSGTKKSIERIELKDVNRFYSDHYTPMGSVIAVVGDFNPTEMKNQLTNLFSSWNNVGKAKNNSTVLPSLDSSRVVVVNKEDARETTLLIGGVGVPRNVSDYIGIQVINTILGGRFTSWLNDELRVNSGLTYGARSGFSAFREGGSFSMSTFTANETTEQTIDLLLKTYQKIHETGIDSKTLESAKNYVKGQFPPDYETNAAIAKYFTDAYTYELPLDYIDHFNEAVSSIDVAKATQIIKDYFPKKNLQMVFIGRDSEITPIVFKYGPVKVLEISEDVYE